MAKKDVELFVEEKRKNEALKKEWENAAEKEAELREDQKEDFFNEQLYPIAKKYGFDFSFDDFCEYKKHNSKSQSSDEELSDDELFDVAGGRSYYPYGPHGPHNPHGEPHGPHGPYNPHGPHNPYRPHNHHETWE